MAEYYIEHNADRSISWMWKYERLPDNKAKGIVVWAKNAVISTEGGEVNYSTPEVYGAEMKVDGHYLEPISREKAFLMMI